MSDVTRDAARRWTQVWQAGWPAHDKAAIVALYAPDARFHPHPFRPARQIADYLDEVFADEVSAVTSFDEPVVDGMRAAVHWHAETRLEDGQEEHLAGVSMLMFTADGLVEEQRDYWHNGAAH